MHKKISIRSYKFSPCLIHCILIALMTSAAASTIFTSKAFAATVFGSNNKKNYNFQIKQHISQQQHNNKYKKQQAKKPKLFKQQIINKQKSNQDYTKFLNYTKKFNQKVTPYAIIISLSQQKLSLYKHGNLVKTYTISSSKYGIGQKNDSLKTPLGLHAIDRKIGHGAHRYAIFKHKKYTGRNWKPGNKYYFDSHSNKVFKRKNYVYRKDHIITRILSLKGLEPGFNNGYSRYNYLVDSGKRNIYIHGTTFESKLGTKQSNGCIYMSSKDVINLFNFAPSGTLVLIER